MSIYLLEPAKKSAIWGGRKLAEDFGKEYEGDRLAETWELSVHPDGPCRIANGGDAGTSFPEWLEKKGDSVLGTNCGRFEDFPILIKLIDARDNLSVQVHPDDEYALAREGQYGKTEMWYVIDCEPGAKLCYGCSRSMTREEFKEHVNDESLEEVLNFVPVHPGDVFFIQSGTIHAIGAGIVIAEIQQNSNITYRVYDYGRTDAQGNRRELHVDKAIEVADLNPPRMDYDFGEHIGKCDYFETDLIRPGGGEAERIIGEDSFACLLAVEGSGSISDETDSVNIKKGDCLFIPAGSGSIRLSGDMTVIFVKIP